MAEPNNQVPAAPPTSAAVPPATPQTAPAVPAAPPTSVPSIDYAKIQQMLDGTLSAKEDTALKAYFKQQGLSQEEAEQAMAAVELGIDAKTIPYVLKMADLGQVMGQDGAINDEAMKTVLNKVLEDIPALKPQAAGAAGFTQVGTGGNPSQQPQQAAAAPQNHAAAKRWNRFN